MQLTKNLSRWVLWGWAVGFAGLFLVHPAWAVELTPADEAGAAQVVDRYLAAYEARDPIGVRWYVDQDSTWYGAGFERHVDAVFGVFSHIRHYTSQRVMLPAEQGVDCLQHCVYVAYNIDTGMSDLNEGYERFHLRKIDDVFRIDRYEQIKSEDRQLMEQGVEALLGNDARAALTAFRDAIENNPDNSVAHYRLGHMMMRLGDVVAARTAFERAVELQPHIGIFRLGLAQSYWDDWRPAGERELAHAVRFDPGLEQFIEFQDPDAAALFEASHDE